MSIRSSDHICDPAHMAKEFYKLIYATFWDALRAINVPIIPMVG
jgi:hypothetical protein